MDKINLMEESGVLIGIHQDINNLNKSYTLRKKTK